MTEATISSIISVDDLKEHLRVVGNDDDGYIGALSEAAVNYCEDYTGLVLGECNFEGYEDRDDHRLFLPVGPVKTITEIAYYDKESDSYVALDAGDYIEDTIDTPARVDIATPQFSMPRLNAIKVNFTAGFEYSKIPKMIIQAIKLLVGHWYENRQEVVTGASVAEVPMAAKALLNQIKMRYW